MVGEAELAAAVLLVVELAGEDVAAFVEAALAPVAVPVCRMSFQREEARVVVKRGKPCSAA